MTTIIGVTSDTHASWNDSGVQVDINGGSEDGKVMTTATLSADDFKNCDFNTIDGRAAAVRILLGAYGCDKDTDDKWMEHLASAYELLTNGGFIKRETRPMNQEELEYFQAGTYEAATSSPALVPYISLLHPQFSSYMSTLGTDKHYRVEVGPWYFDPYLTAHNRGALIVHEVMHGVLGHLSMVNVDHQLSNIAGDDVINQQIEHSGMKLPCNPDGSEFGYFPRNTITKKYPHGMKENLYFGDYYQALVDEKDRLMKEARQKAGKEEEAGLSDGKPGDRPANIKGGLPGKPGSPTTGGDTDNGQSGTGSGEDANGQQDSGSGSDKDGEPGDANVDGQKIGTINHGASTCNVVTSEVEDSLDKNGGNPANIKGGLPGRNGTPTTGDNSDNGQSSIGSGDNANDQTSDNVNGQPDSGDGSGEDGEPGDATVDGQKIGNINHGTSTCNVVTSEVEDSLDSDGVQKAKPEDIDMARNKAVLAAMHEADEGRGTSGSNFNSFILNLLKPSRINWKSQFRNIVSRNYNSIINGHADITYSQPDRRRSENPYNIVYPGEIGYAPEVIVGVDTSGSMSEDDYNKALAEVRGILKQTNSPKIRFVTIDTEVTADRELKGNVRSVKLDGGGGTEMNVFYRYINRLRHKPDMSVLMTDGFIDWEDVLMAMNMRMRNIILITDKGGYDCYKSNVHRKFRGLTVLPIFQDR